MCIHDFRVDHLVSNNQLGGSSLRKMKPSSLKSIIINYKISQEKLCWYTLLMCENPYWNPLCFFKAWYSGKASGGQSKIKIRSKFGNILTASHLRIKLINAIKEREGGYCCFGVRVPNTTSFHKSAHSISHIRVLLLGYLVLLGYLNYYHFSKSFKILCISPSDWDQILH